MQRGMGPDERKACREVYELFWDTIVAYIATTATSYADLLTRLGVLVSDAEDVGYEPRRERLSGESVGALKVKGIPLKDIERLD